MITISKPFISMGAKVILAQAQKYLGKSIDDKIIFSLKKKLDFEIEELIKKVNFRTLLYIFFSIINVLILNILISFPIGYFAWGAFFISIGFIIYIVFNTLVFVKNGIYYAENFEENVKLKIVQSFEDVKEESLTAKIVLFLDSREAHDYYRLILDKTLTHFSDWIRENKSIIYIRLAFLLLSSLSFSFSFRILLEVFLGW